MPKDDATLSAASAGSDAYFTAKNRTSENLFKGACSFVRQRYNGVMTGNNTNARETTMNAEHEYPTIRLRRTEYGYISRDGRYAVVRDTCSDIGSSNAGCYKACWHVHRDSPTGERIAKFLDSLGEARVEIACDMEKCPEQHLCRHGIDK